MRAYPPTRLWPRGQAPLGWLTLLALPSRGQPRGRCRACVSMDGGLGERVWIRLENQADPASRGSGDGGALWNSLDPTHFRWGGFREGFQGWVQGPYRTLRA